MPYDTTVKSATAKKKKKKVRQAVGFHEIWTEAKQYNIKESRKVSAFASFLLRRK